MTTMPQNPAIDILMLFAAEYMPDDAPVDMAVWSMVTTAVQSALVLALVDPGWALRVTRLAMRTIAADTGIPHVAAMLNEWDSARAFITAHPLAEG